MSADSHWAFAGATQEGNSFSIEGIDVWKHAWTDTKRLVQVEDPLYRQKFTFHVYEISEGDKTLEFAAGEFSNGVWGFYAKTLPDHGGRISINPDICNGRPAVRGTRIMVQTVLGFLAAGDSIEDVLEEYPSLVREDIQACLDYASSLKSDSQS